MEQFKQQREAKGGGGREMLWLVEWDDGVRAGVWLIGMAGRVARAWSCHGAVERSRNTTTVAGRH